MLLQLYYQETILSSKVDAHHFTHFCLAPQNICHPFIQDRLPTEATVIWAKLLVSACAENSQALNIFIYNPDIYRGRL